MTKEDIQLLYEYDRWANNRVLQAVTALTAEQFARDLGGGFRSVRDTLVHIIAGHWGWIEYWKEADPGSQFLTDLQKRKEALFNPASFPDVAALKVKREQVDKEMEEFMAGLTSESLENMIPVRGTHLTLAHLMQHVANHSTYHRGQVSLIMRQLNAQPAATDFHVFLAESSREPAT